MKDMIITFNFWLLLGFSDGSKFLGAGKTSLSSETGKKLLPVSRVTAIPGWYWILGIECSDTTGVRLV